MRRRRAAKRQRLVAFALRRSMFRLILVLAVSGCSLCSLPLSWANSLSTEASLKHQDSRSHYVPSDLALENEKKVPSLELGDGTRSKVGVSRRNQFAGDGEVGVGTSSTNESQYSSSPVEVIAPPWKEEGKAVMDPSWLSQPTEGQQVMNPQWNQNGVGATTNESPQDNVEVGDGSESYMYNTYSPSYAPGDLAAPVAGVETNVGGGYGYPETSGTPSDNQVLQAPWQQGTGDSGANQIMSPPWMEQDGSQGQALIDPVWNDPPDEGGSVPNYPNGDAGSSYGSAGNQVMQAPWSQAEGDSSSQSAGVMTPPWAAQGTPPSQSGADPGTMYQGQGGGVPYSDPSTIDEFQGDQWTGSTDSVGSGQLMSPPWNDSTTGTESQTVLDPVWTNGGASSGPAENPYYYGGSNPSGFQTVPGQYPSMSDASGNMEGGQEGGSSYSGSSSGSGYGVTGVPYGQLPNVPSWSNSMGGNLKGSKGRGCSSDGGTPSSKGSKLKKKEKCEGNQAKQSKQKFHKDPLQSYPTYFQPPSAVPPSPSPVPTTSRPTELQLVKFPTQAPLSRAPVLVSFTMAPVLYNPVSSAPGSVSPPFPSPVTTSGAPLLVPLPAPSPSSASPAIVSSAPIATGTGVPISSPSSSGAPAEPSSVGPVSGAPFAASQSPIAPAPTTTPPSVPSTSTAPASPVSLTVSPSTVSPISLSPAAVNAPTSAIAPATAPSSSGPAPSSTTTGLPAPVGTSVPTSTPSPPATGPPQASGAPSLAGSTPATAGPTATALQAQMKQVRVLAYPVTVEASGPMDLATAKETFFNVTMDVLQSYLDSYLGPVLQEFNMKITFHQSKTTVQPVGVTGSTVLVTSYFVLEMDFKVASESLETLQSFTQKKATDLVKGLFNGSERDKLLAELDAAGIRLESIRVVDSALVTGGANDAATSDASGEAENGNTKEGQSSGGKSTLLYAGIASAGIVAFGAAAMYYAHRKRKRGWFDNAEESIEQSLYSNGGHGPPNGKVLPVLTPNGVSTVKTSRTSSLGSSQTSTRSRVKPAALTLRNKQNMKSQGSVSTLGSFMALNPVLEKLGIEDDGSEEKEDEETARFRRREDAMDAPASNRSHFGNDYSLDGDNQSFRDLGYSGQPRGQNSTWSIDGLSIDDDSEAERIIDHARRRRWQDNSGASALGSLPDHNSELGYDEGNNTYYEGSASSLGPMD